MKIAVISSSLGDFDGLVEHVKQNIEADYFRFTDENFPPRKVMSPRLQAKIPKMFGWQLAPGYDYYLWIDGNMSLNHENALRYFYDEIQGHDIAVIKHHRRNTVTWEARYTERALNEQSKYTVARYENEFLKEQTEAIKADKDFVDDLMVIGGVFMYRNNERVQKMFKEWWYNVSRYIVQDQISFPYAMKKAGLKIKALDHDYTKWDYLKRENHNKRYE